VVLRLLAKEAELVVDRPLKNLSESQEQRHTFVMLQHLLAKTFVALQRFLANEAELVPA